MTRRTRLSGSLNWFGRRVGAILQATAFWTAICLPVAYLPLLTAESVAATLLVAVVTLHASALLVGHSHRLGSVGDVSVRTAPGREEGY